MFSRGAESSNLDASLLANYTFDNGDATDTSGHGNNGIIHGNPTFVDSSRGKAIKLSASPNSQLVEFKDFDVPDTFSVSLWLKPSSTADGQSFLGKHTYDGNNIFVMGYWDNGYEVNIGDAYYSSKGTGAKTADYQHLVAVVKKVDDTKSKVTVYKNNKELWSQDINGVIGSTKGKGWALGQDWDGSNITDLFKGEIDEVAIYNRDLTASEVGYLYGSKSTVNNTYDKNSTDNLVSMNLNNVEYYYIRNAQGDIIGLFDNTEKQVASYTYDSWGKLISIKDGSGADITNNTGSVGYKNPYRYRGYRYDTETGLYYLQSRYYNSEWGRFINADGYLGTPGELLSFNMFTYCGNNPVNRDDLNGKF